MAKIFLLFMLACALFAFFLVDLDSLGGNTAFGWLCPDSWSACRKAGYFLSEIGI